MNDLDARLLAAHASGDRAALVALYREAGETALAGGRAEAGAFYLTHAYIHALEAGDLVASALRARLVALGRESV